jgi:hypothetical protein
LHDGAFAYGTINYRVGIGSSNSDSLFVFVAAAVTARRRR